MARLSGAPGAERTDARGATATPPAPPSGTEPALAGRVSLAWGPPLVVVLALGVPALIALQPSQEPRDTVFWVQLLLTAYIGASFAWAVASPVPALLRTVFWLFTYTAMGIAPLAQAVLGLTPIAQIGDRAHLLAAVVLTFVGCVAFDVGTRLGGRAVVSAQAPRLREVTSTGTLALTVLALVGTAALVATIGVDAFFTSRQGLSAELGQVGAEESEAGRATVRALGTVPVLVLFLLLTRRLVVDPGARRRPHVVATWCGALAAQLVVNNPISNPRFWFLTVMISIFLVAIPGRLQLFRLAMLAGLAASLVLFPLADVFRYDDGPLDRYRGLGMLETIATKDYDQMTMFANTVTYVEDGPGHTLGGQALGAVLFAVPRSVWPGKPIDTGVEIGQYMNNNLVNLSEPVWAELWLDFGAAGMLLAMLALGGAVRWLDDRYDRLLRWYPRSTSATLLLVPALAGYEFILLRGSLLQAMGRLSVLVVCVVLLAVLARRVAPPAGASTDDRSGRQPGGEQEDDRVERPVEPLQRPGVHP
jgi:hypothetical protein